MALRPLLFGFLSILAACTTCDADVVLEATVAPDESLPSRHETARALFERLATLAMTTDMPRLTDHDWGPCPQGFDALGSLALQFALRETDVSVTYGCGLPHAALFEAEGTLTTSTGLVVDTPVSVVMSAAYDGHVRSFRLIALADATPLTTSAFDASGCVPPEGLRVELEFSRVRGRLELTDVEVRTGWRGRSWLVASWPLDPS